MLIFLSPHSEFNQGEKGKGIAQNHLMMNQKPSDLGQKTVVVMYKRLPKVWEAKLGKSFCRKLQHAKALNTVNLRKSHSK